MQKSLPQVDLVKAKQLGTHGDKIATFCQNNDAILGINASGFIDPKGVGNGGKVNGSLVVDGVEYGEHKMAPAWKFVGLDKKNKLYVVNYKNTDVSDYRWGLMLLSGSYRRWCRSRQRRLLYGYPAPYYPRPGKGWLAPDARHRRPPARLQSRLLRSHLHQDHAPLQGLPGHESGWRQLRRHATMMAARSQNPVPYPAKGVTCPMLCWSIVSPINTPKAMYPPDAWLFSDSQKNIPPTLFPQPHSRRSRPVPHPVPPCHFSKSQDAVRCWLRSVCSTGNP